MGQFDEFCKQTKAMHLPAKGLDVAAVLDDYFEQKPPFGEGKKKSEFPDAFTAQLLINWRAGRSRKVIVVSGDRDWAAIGDARLEVLDNIAKLRFLATRAGTRLLCAARSWALVGFQGVGNVRLTWRRPRRVVFWRVVVVTIGPALTDNSRATSTS